MHGRTATLLAATLVLATHTASDAASIAPALCSCCLAQKEPVLDPFAPKPKAADPQPAAPKTPSLNPFAPPPADNQPNPFAPKKPAESTTKPTEKPKETPPAEAPKPPAELLIGTAWNVKPDPATTPLATAAPAAIPAPGAPPPPTSAANAFATASSPPRCQPQSWVSDSTKRKTIPATSGISSPTARSARSKGSPSKARD